MLYFKMQQERAGKNIKFAVYLSVGNGNVTLLSLQEETVEVNYRKQNKVLLSRGRYLYNPRYTREQKLLQK